MDYGRGRRRWEGHGADEGVNRAFGQEEVASRLGRAWIDRLKGFIEEGHRDPVRRVLEASNIEEED